MRNRKTAATVSAPAASAEANRQERMRLYHHGKEQAERLKRVIDRVLDGETETTACLEENVEKHWLRRFVRGDISIGRGQEEGKDGIRIELDDWICWQDKFLIELTGTEHYAPVDFDEVYRECVSMACTEQEQEVLRMRFEEGLTLRETGERIGKSQERVRQTENTAMRKLRRPSYRLQLVYGKEYQEQIKKVKTAQAEYDKTRMARMKALREERIAAIQRLKEKEKQLIEEIEELKAADSSQFPDPIEEIPISEAGFSVRAFNALHRHMVRDGKGRLQTLDPINTVGQLSRMSHDELRRIANLGPSTLKEIDDVLFREYGITLS